MSLQVGDIITFKRTYTVEDVEMFTKVSGDEGTHHLVPDENGRLIIQGLFTATLPTKRRGLFPPFFPVVIRRKKK
ncbi:hypothetical protein SAMN05216352_104194 [Alteribacillus bidgolensis]|uniref:MaoC like domain-containing protein n=1 Tax=Alteribacillus bidgolensis TaxID=930129 RepID=A0A1G8HC45_9BACI|nr:hypothetical protein SAMN05216352_104194 [Alteribacillus bidgolensis]